MSRRRFSVQRHLQALSASTLKQKTSEKEILEELLGYHRVYCGA